MGVLGFGGALGFALEQPIARGMVPAGSCGENGPPAGSPLATVHEHAGASGGNLRPLSDVANLALVPDRWGSCRGGDHDAVSGLQRSPRLGISVSPLEKGHWL